MIDLDDNRLQTARSLGATHLINSKMSKRLYKSEKLNPRGVDVAIEAVGIPKLLTYVKTHWCRWYDCERRRSWSTCSI